MAKPDRAARVAGRSMRECCSRAECVERVAASIRREVKRAVEEEREAIAAEIEGVHESSPGIVDTGRMHRNAMRQGLAAAIRARGER